MSAPLSAAQRMQQAHEGNSTATATPDFISEDPFPVAALPPAVPTVKPSSANKSLDTTDESAFPSLGAPTVNGKPKALWGGGGAAALRVKEGAPTSRGVSPAPSALSRSSTPGPANATGEAYTTTVRLPTSDIHISAPPPPRGQPRAFSNERRDAPNSLGEVLKEVMRRHEGVVVEASSSSKMTTFILRARGPTAEQKVEKARVELLQWLEKKVSEGVQVPAGLRAVIIGAKGRTLKGITDSTGAQIQIPRDDELPAPSADAAAADGSDEGPLITITLTGASSAVSAAKAQILAIVRERTSKVTLAVPDVPVELWALLGARVAAVLERLQVPEGEVTVNVPRRNAGKRGVDVSKPEEAGKDEKEREKKVTVSGDKEVAKRVVEGLEAEVVDLRSTVRPVTFPLPKRQHRFLVGTAIADQILSETGCAVEVPPAESNSEDVVVRGPGRETVKAMQLVMDLASATPVETLDLFTAHRGAHNPRTYAAQVVRYLLAKQRLRPIASASGTSIYLPRPALIASSTPESLPNAWLEIVGSKETGAQGVAQARAGVIGEVRRLPPSVMEAVEVDPLVLRHINGAGAGKKAGGVRQKAQEVSVEIVFPVEESGEPVLLVYTGEDPAKASEALGEVKAQFDALAATFSDLVTATLAIPNTLHGAVIGTGGTTLNAVIGEERLVHVQFGGAAGKDDEVTIRGPKEEVERVRKELERIAEDAKNEEIVNSHVVDFTVPTEQVRHIVGKAGSGVNKLRDDLGVRVDFAENDASAAKGTKKTSTVTIKGRKENVEEARRRIESTAERMADEVTLTIPLPAGLERGSLIGKQGTYLKRLEEKYFCAIRFPRDGRKANGDDESPSTPSSNEIVIRGPSKGAQAAKGELIALIEYEKEHGNVVSFSVAVKALPRILGRGGSQINLIKDETGVASLDVDQESPEATTATVSLRGTKSAIKKAREMVERIAKEVEDEARLEMEIPKEYHTTLIGSGGSSIRDLIVRCGGPSDARASGNTVRFPRQGADNNTVTITAPSSVAQAIKAALEKEVATLASRIVYGVVVPQGAHAAVIGKGAQALQDLQRKHGVKVVMPGWNDYAQAGEIENKDDEAVAAADEKDLVKVVGPKEAVLAAAEDLRAVKPRGGAPMNGGSGRNSAAAHQVEVAVPKSLHAVVAQGGRFFRSLPSGVRISHRGAKPPSSALKAKKPPVAANGAGEDELSLQVVPVAEEAAAEDGDIPWVVESNNEEDAQKVAEDIKRSVEKGKTATHVGWVTVPRGLMPRIVGRGGSGLDRLRSSGVEVEVVGKRDANQLTLTGAPASIQEAYETIQELNAPRPNRREARIDDDY